jgi:uncharacterized protein (TIGR02996 family)
MNQDEAFIQAIREEPDDDAVRLIYADWLEDQGVPERAARGEFIRVQVEQARTSINDPCYLALQIREEALLQTHWDAWVGPLREALGNPTGSSFHNAWLDRPFAATALSHFRRGFVETVTVTGRRFINCAEKLARLTPIRQVRLGLAGSLIDQIGQLSMLSQVESLEFVDYFVNPLGPACARELARSPHLGRLRRLGLQRNNLQNEGLQALASAPWLAGLHRLNLVENGLSGQGFQALTSSPFVPRLTALSVGSNLPGNGLIPLVRSPLVSHLRSLDLSNSAIHPDTLAEALAGAPLEGLTHLDLSRNPLGPRGANTLAETPVLGQLTTLNLDGCGLGDDGFETLVSSPHLGNLRGLTLRGNQLTARSVALIMRTGLLDRLRVLELEGNPMA